MKNKANTENLYDPAKEFNQEISVEKAGKTIKWKEFIRENNEDVEPYSIIAKYNLEEFEKTIPNYKSIQGDFTDLQDTRKNLDRQIKAEELWNDLPLSVRKEFAMDKNEFLDRGEQWLKEKITEEYNKEKTYFGESQYEKMKQEIELKEKIRSDLKKQEILLREKLKGEL